MSLTIEKARLLVEQELQRIVRGSATVKVTSAREDGLYRMSAFVNAEPLAGFGFTGLYPSPHACAVFALAAVCKELDAADERHAEQARAHRELARIASREAAKVKATLLALAAR